MARKCELCTDQFITAKVERCPKCIRLAELGMDRIAILERHAKLIPHRAQRYAERIEQLRQLGPKEEPKRHCNICGTAPTAKHRTFCQDCFGLKKTISDPYEICQAMIKKRPEKAAQYQAMADQHRQKLIEASVDAEREIRTNRRLAALAASTKPCKPRITTTNGVESTCQYWRCGRCRQVLTKPTCLKCEMIIKGEIQDE
jgi:hypothetical protein